MKFYLMCPVYHRPVLELARKVSTRWSPGTEQEAFEGVMEKCPISLLLPCKVTRANIFPVSTKIATSIHCNVYLPLLV